MHIAEALNHFNGLITAASECALYLNYAALSDVSENDEWGERWVQCNKGLH